MALATAVREVGAPVELDARPQPEPILVSEQAPYQPRFRVVTRKPLAPPTPTRVSSTHRTSLVAAIPAVCLLVYVTFWTLAIRGGYYRDQLQDQLHGLMVEQAELQADKLGEQSPGKILSRAGALGMQAAMDTEFARLPAPAPVAKSPAPEKPVRQARGTDTNLTR